MKTIHPRELNALLEAGQPVEIVDIRSRADFARVHINGAHSMPSAEISSKKLLCARKLMPADPIYLVSESGALAQLQACDLERQGLDNIVIVSGGMHLWQRDQLPVLWSDGLAKRCNGRCAVCQTRSPAKTPVGLVDVGPAQYDDKSLLGG